MAIVSEIMDNNERLGTESGALQNIVAWSADRPMWQRDALRRLCSKNSLDEDDYKELLVIAKGNEANAVPLTAVHVPSPDSTNKTVNLKSINDTKHVNALKSGECLSFGKGNGITVIYGDNGSGKSGYARILKSACRARIKGKQEIHPNIHSENSGTPQANINFTVDNQSNTATWMQGTETTPQLSAISVFDSDTASIHVDEDNEVAYNPFPLELLKRLSKACQEIQHRISSERDKLEQQRPAFLNNPKCAPSTLVGQMIANLNASTNIKTIEKLAQISDEEQKRYDRLKVELASDPEVIARKLNTDKNKLEKYKTQVEFLHNIARDEILQDIQTKYRGYLAKKESAKIAAEELFKDEELPNIGADTWRDLWDAARRYSDAEVYPKHPFPHTEEGANCVLCHQTLSSKAAKRLESFETFVKDDAKKAEEQAQELYENALNKIQSHNIKIASIPEIMQFITDDIGHADMAKTIKKCIVKAKWRLRKFKTNHGINLATYPLTPIPDGQLNNIFKDLLGKISGLTSQEISATRQKLKQEHDELQDKRWLVVVHGDLLAEIERLKTCKQLKKLFNENKTTTITAKSTELAKSLVTDALRTQFAKETQKLKLIDLAIELRKAQSKAGSVFFKVALSGSPNKTVSAILSEGEFRCVALAAFMAEQATIESNSTIVFDDPVNSLDHMHQEYVASRLAEEAVNRQVVIFTHNLAFLFFLEEACFKANANIYYRSISRNDDATGFCSDEAPPKKRPIKNAVVGLEKHLENVRGHYSNGDAMKWEHEISYFRFHLRPLWERAVEEVVAPVIKRFKNKIKTNELKKLTAITMDDCKKMRDAYGRCSFPVHSDGEGLNRPSFTPKDIEYEINCLKDWITDIKERQEKITNN